MNIPDTSPQYKFRAADRFSGKVYYFGFTDIHHSANGPYLLVGNGRTLYLKSCDVDLFTGHSDKDGVEMYGGDVLRKTNSNEEEATYVLIAWHVHYDSIATWHSRCFSFCRLPLCKSTNWDDLWHVTHNSVVIGNIHNIEALPEEVRKMLNKTQYTNQNPI